MLVSSKECLTEMVEAPAGDRSPAPQAHGEHDFRHPNSPAPPLEADALNLLPCGGTWSYAGDGEDEGEQRPSLKSGGSSGPALQALRVVIVEDEAIIALEIEDTFAHLGAEVVGSALSAEEAVKLVEELQPDLVTMDISLRGERDGVSAAIEIFERFGIRSVFISAYENPENYARAEPANPIGWVGKPLRRNKLEAALRGMLRDEEE